MSDKPKDKLKDNVMRDNVMRFEFPEGVINPIVFSTPESKENWKKVVSEAIIPLDMHGGFTFANFVFKLHEALQKAIDDGLYNIRISSDCFLSLPDQIVIEIYGERQETKAEAEERIKEDLTFFQRRKAETLESLHRQEESIKKLEKCLEELALKNENR